MAKERRVTFSTRRFLVGRAGPFPRLVFREDVMLHLDQFCHLHTHGENGGFLVGKKRDLKSAERYEILVERFIPVTQAERAARLVLTEAHMQTVQQALDQGGEGNRIVGWAHTHPGFGVFLSNFDKEQHLRFFPEPWQVAYVMDNQSNQRAAYHAAEGQWRKLEGYYVLKEMAHNEIVLPARKIEKRQKSLVSLVFLIALLAGALVLGYSWLQRLATPIPAPPDISRPVGGEGREGAHEENRFGVETEDEHRVVSDSTAPVEVEAGFAEYIVQEGDTLWKIAEKLWGDPNLFPLIAEENALSDPGFLPVGKVLLIPERPRSTH